MPRNRKIFSTILVCILIVAAGSVFFFLYRMGANDAKALAEFPIAYQDYDQAIADYSASVFVPNAQSSSLDDLEFRANEALALLNSTASIRISSLTRNDGDLMESSHEIANLAGKELQILKEYRAANDHADLNVFVKQFRALTLQRQAHFAQYQELAGIK